MEKSVWFLAGNGGMGHWDYYWALYRDHYKDPFPHSLLSTKQKFGNPEIAGLRQLTLQPRLASQAQTPHNRIPGGLETQVL